MIILDSGQGLRYQFNMSFEICFTRRYCMSHRLFNAKNSRCFVPHGHNEYVKVYLVAKDDRPLDGDLNMVAPFYLLKEIWHKWIDDHVDHCLQLSSLDPMLDYFKIQEPESFAHLMIMPGDPTTELLSACFMSKINVLLHHQGLDVYCHKVEIVETPTNTVIFSGDPTHIICRDHYNAAEIPWWQRPDMSINDLDI